MTFIPSVLTQKDTNNSTTNFTGTTYTGSTSSTIGYNSIIVVVQSTQNSVPRGLQIQFSSDGFDTFRVGYVDTVFSNTVFKKTYPIEEESEYRIQYEQIGGTTTITTRISTQEAFSSTVGVLSLSAFDNSLESTNDAFQRLRISHPVTLLDLRVPGQDSSGNGSSGTATYKENLIQICSKSVGTGGGTSSKVCNNSITTITCTGDSTFTNQSRKYVTYQPGKSFLVLTTAILNANTNTFGIKSRIGYFDDYNGLYFEYDSDGNVQCSVCLRSEGSVVWNVDQTNWNIDPMNGTGPSGLNLQFDKAQIFVIDFEWLGVGRIRFGFYVYGKIQYCHEVTNMNELSMGPFASNINLPLRCQLVGTVGGTGSLIQICGSIISEGGYTPIGKPFSVIRSNISGIASNVLTPIMFLRGGGVNFYHQIILPTVVSIASSSVNDIFILQLYFFLSEYVSTSLSSLTWQTADSLGNSVAEFSTTGTITNISNGIIMFSEAVSGKGSSSLASLGNVFNEIVQITSDVDNLSSVLAITVHGNFGGGSNTYLSLNWSEIY